MRLSLHLVVCGTLGACGAHEEPLRRPAPAPIAVGVPSSAYVSSLPPEPLYEQMAPSPGYGTVWIDGSWHWNGAEWVWISGRWEREQPGYLYVSPGYSYVDARYVYTPGYWSRPELVPAAWARRDGHDGRPTLVIPPPNTPPLRGEPAHVEPAPTHAPTFHAPSVPHSAPSRSSRERR